MTIDAGLRDLSTRHGDGRIQRTSLTEQTFQLLRRGIISGEIGPGEIHSAQALAQRLGVSSSPVREAMLMLVNEGLMTPVRNRGYLVVTLTRDEMYDVHEVRMMTEVPAMVELARRSAEFDFAPFRAMAEEIIRSADAADVASYIEADRAFHLGLTDLLQNARLTKLIATHRDQTRRFGIRALSRQGRLSATAREHIAILDAIVAGDENQTATLMNGHLTHIINEWEPDGHA